MSLLRAHGHASPEKYALGFLVDESNLVEEREATRMLQEAELLRVSVATLLSKEARKGLKEIRDALNVEARPRNDLIAGSETERDGPQDDSPEDFDGG